MTLIHIIMENRNRPASGPVHALPSIPLHGYIANHLEGKLNILKKQTIQPTDIPP